MFHTLALLLGSLAPAQDPLVSTGPDFIAESNTVEVSVIHAGTGQPVVGARVLGGHEALFPVWGETWWRVETVTGADGVAVLPTSRPGAEYNRIVATAPGMATRMLNSRGDDGPERIEMPVEVPLEMELVYPDGTPATLVHVGAVFGCGHTPDVVSAVSDHRGRLTLRGLSPEGEDNGFDFFPAGEGVRTDYLNLDQDDHWEAGKVERVVVQRGVSVRGKVIGLDGKPAAGVFVGQPHRHRGPWARTDADGRFHLMGTEVGNPSLQIRGADESYIGFFEHSMRGLPVTLQLTRQDEDAPEPVRYPLTVDLSGSPSLEGIRSLTVAAWNPATGLRVESGPSEEGVATLQVDAGTWFVQVGGKGEGAAEILAGSVHVTEDSAGARIEAVVPPLMVRKLRFVNTRGMRSWMLRDTGVEERRRWLDWKDSLGAPDDLGNTWVGVMDSVVLPAGEWSVWVDIEGQMPLVPTEVVGDEDGVLTLRVVQ